MVAFAREPIANRSWEKVKRARQIPDDFWNGVLESEIEQLAFEFALWAVGEAHRPTWLPLTEEEERYREAQRQVR